MIKTISGLSLKYLIGLLIAFSAFNVCLAMVVSDMKIKPIETRIVELEMLIESKQANLIALTNSAVESSLKR